MRDRGTSAGIAWGSQISYLMQYKLFKPKEVHPATKRYMTFPPKDNMKNATLVLGDVANEGKRFATWAK